VVGIIDGFNGPAGFVITPDGTHAYVNNYGVPPNVGTGNTVSVVDLTTNPPSIELTITVELAPAAMAITPDGKYVYVVNYIDGNPNDGTVGIIDTSDNSYLSDVVSGLFGPFQIAITPDGKYAYVTNFGSNNFTPVGTTVSVIDLSSNTISDTITLGIQPAAIAITPDGSSAYVSNYSTLYNGPGYMNLISGQGTIDIVQLPTNAVISSIIGGLGFSPSAISISPNGQFAYVANYSSNTVSVIALPSPLYNINRLTPHYSLQLDETMNQLQQAGL
jgi:YVTN family beta-propeller protein